MLSIPLSEHIVPVLQAAQTMPNIFTPEQIVAMIQYAPVIGFLWFSWRDERKARVASETKYVDYSAKIAEERRIENEQLRALLSELAHAKQISIPTNNGAVPAP